MRKIIFACIAIIMTAVMSPMSSIAAGGIYASSGGSHVEGDTFSVTIRASGATFNAFQGTISVSGSATVVSIGAGSATWVKQPSNGGQFVGMVTSSTTSLTIATVRLKAGKPGTGSVNVSGVSLANNGAVVGTGAGGTSFTVTRAPVVPGSVTVTSTSHPDQNNAYDATTIVLNWEKAAGVTGFSYILDQVPDTALANKADSANTTMSYTDQKIGTYYFHIKAQNGDGWGPTTVFKIQIKEPDAKIQTGLAKPSGITISKASNFKNSISNGTVTGIVIKGKISSKSSMEKVISDTTAEVSPSTIESSTKELYSANILLDPEQVLPEGKKLSVTPDKYGNFRLVIDWPIRAGAYGLMVQGQRDKLLTPKSDKINFEIEQHDGGAIVRLSNKDLKKYVPTTYEKFHDYIFGAGIGAGLIIIVFLIVLLIFKLVRPNTKKSKPVKPSFKWE